MSAMSLKDFRRLGKRDFANGAVLDEIEKALEQREDLLAACKAIVSLANVAHSHWDADEDHKVGKILLAMAGHLKGYLRETDAIHAALSKAEAP